MIFNNSLYGCESFMKNRFEEFLCSFWNRFKNGFAKLNLTKEREKGREKEREKEREKNLDHIHEIHMDRSNSFPSIVPPII